MSPFQLNNDFHLNTRQLVGVLASLVGIAMVVANLFTIHAREKEALSHFPNRLITVGETGPRILTKDAIYL